MGQFSWPRFLRRSSLFQWFLNAALIGIAITVGVFLYQFLYTVFENKYLPVIGCTKHLPCPQPSDIRVSIVIYFCSVILGVFLVIGICSGIYTAIVDSIDQVKRGVPFTELVCFHVISVIAVIIGSLVAFLAVAWVVGHLIVTYDIMDMQKQILTHNPNINASKIGLGLACLLCTVIGSVPVGLLVYWIYSSFCESLQATVKELDIERQQTTAKNVD